MQPKQKHHYTCLQDKLLHESNKETAVLVLLVFFPPTPAAAPLHG